MQTDPTRLRQLAADLRGQQQAMMTYRGMTSIDEAAAELEAAADRSEQETRVRDAKAARCEELIVALAAREALLVKARPFVGRQEPWSAAARALAAEIDAALGGKMDEQ